MYLNKKILNNNKFILQFEILKDYNILKMAFQLMDEIAQVAEHERNSTTEHIKRILNH